MRMLLKATLDNQRASEAIQEGTIGQALQELMEELRPEAAYFFSEHGKRTAFFVFDMESPAQLPPISEPLYQVMGADVHVTPVMDQNDLRAGLQEVQGS